MVPHQLHIRRLIVVADSKIYRNHDKRSIYTDPKCLYIQNVQHLFINFIRFKMYKLMKSVTQEESLKSARCARIMMSFYLFFYSIDVILMVASALILHKLKEKHQNAS